MRSGQASKPSSRSPITYVEDVFASGISAPRLPNFLLGLSVLAIGIGTFFMFAGGQNVGATWDERIHGVMLEHFFETGWYGSPDWFVDNEPVTPIGLWPYFVYAPVSSLFVHFWAVVLGAEPWTGFSDSSAAHAARHVGTAFLGVLGVLGVALLVRVIGGSWRWAVLGGALLAITPMWVGHAMFNVKDLPVGVGYTFVTLGVVMILHPKYGRNRPDSHMPTRIPAWLSIIFGLLLAVGTRPASGFPMALTAGVVAMVLVFLAVRQRKSKEKAYNLAPRITDLAGSFLTSYLILVALYPKGFLDPFQLVKETLLISGRFPVNDAVVTNGIWMSQPPPWTYLPTWFLAQLPIIISVGAIAFFFIWFVRAYQAWFGKREHGPQWAWLLMTATVMTQAALFPLLAILANSTIYNAVRQFLFVPPALAVMAALSFQILWTYWRINGARVLPTLMVGVVGVGLFIPLVAQARLFPYNYVYFNLVTATKPIDGNWATDYWRASGPEIVQLLPPTGDVSCIYVDEFQSFRPCEEDPTLAPYWEQRAMGQFIQRQLRENEYWLIRENYGDLSAPPGCVLHDSVTRPLFHQSVTLAQIFRCDA